MSLRVRIALVAALLVLLALVSGGLGLRALLRGELEARRDRSLRDAAALALTLVQDEDGHPKLRRDEAQLSRFGGGLSVLALDRAGRVVDRLGLAPPGLSAPPMGFSNPSGWRAWTQPVLDGAIVALEPTAPLESSLAGLDRALSLLAPLAAFGSFALGLLLAALALRPVDRLTRSALDLAARRAWRERLPEPRARDELWRLSRATNELLGALGQVIEAERHFTADAAHELRTPLTVLRGRLEGALERVREPATRAALEPALEATGGLITLVEKLLALAQAEAGQGLRTERLALDRLALEVADDLRPLAAAKGLRLTPDLPERAAWVRGDRVALGLAVRNLLENALKFTAQGEVCLSVLASSGRVTLTVEDSGAGIPEAALPHLFERFYQADARYRRAGSGLGLALVSSVARWHGGRVVAENRALGGARFTLELPGA